MTSPKTPWIFLLLSFGVPQPALSQTVPPELGQCLAKSLDGEPLTAQNLAIKTIWLECNQPICAVDQLAILDPSTGAISCQTAPSPVPAAPTDLKLQIDSTKGIALENQKPSEQV